MSDVHSAAVRSFNMSRIRSENTGPELLLRKVLFANGFRFRLHDKSLPGKPDIVLKKFKTVVFVHGCFWHGHQGCKYFVVPKTRTEWWQNKIAGNQRNDAVKRAALTLAGWNVLEVFECALKKDKLPGTIKDLIDNIKRLDHADTNKNH
ncbi:MAG TPA: very short patch repair endonuclease [Phnomibacter sp.]|nr:very short patch repair endonuclease [Phnomibacter sp.]